MRGDGVKNFRVALAQINCTVGDFKGNEEKITRAMDTARAAGASLVTYPELALTGYPPEDLLFQKHFVDENLRALGRVAKQNKGIDAVIGFVDRGPNGELYNAAAFLSGGKVKAVYHKRELPNYGVFDERRYFNAGQKSCVVRARGCRMALTICEDIWEQKGAAYARSFAKDADLIVNLSASPFHQGKQAVRRGLVSRLARLHGRPVLYQNLVGGQDELVFDGGSFAVNGQGKLIAEASRFKEDLLVVDIKVKGTPHGGSPVSEMKPEEEVYSALVLGTKDYVQKSGFKKVVIGLSGGIDSALVAQIAVDALGAANVVGVTLPSPYTSLGTYRDAKLLARRLGIECLEFKIDRIFKSYLETLKKAFTGLKPDKTEENLQARIRGNLLMALSNKWGWLVLTTGNKSEMATGYCTLYGDMAGGFAVIKDVPKTLVFRLARYRNAWPPGNSIPPSIIKRPPTAELKIGQKDQDTLPPYEILDVFLEGYVERHGALERIRVARLSPGAAQKVAGMINANEYKRRQAPPGIKITPMAFGRDRRMPLVNRFHP